MSSYLATLRRVPDDVILAVATRDLQLGDPSTCVCGWVWREALARACGKSADVVGRTEVDTELRCMEVFGGTEREWSQIFVGVLYQSEAPLIEEAFVERVMEAAGGE